MSQVGHMVAPTIYEIVYPHRRGEVLGLLTQALTASENFDVFHERLLRQFIPVRQLSQLRVERYERLQAEGEPLAMYIQSIRDTALIVRISETEAQVVQRIVEGLTPIQRARFVFQDLPSTFVQLEQLIVVDRNITYADKTRQLSASMGRAKAVETASTSFVSSHRRSPASKKPFQGKTVVCFYCGKTEHIQINCFASLAQKRKLVRILVTRP
jgi:hypothetical protein